MPRQDFYQISQKSFETLANKFLNAYFRFTGIVTSSYEFPKRASFINFSSKNPAVGTPSDTNLENMICIGFPKPKTYAHQLDPRDIPEEDGQQQDSFETEDLLQSFSTAQDQADQRSVSYRTIIADQARQLIRLNRQNTKEYKEALENLKILVKQGKDILEDRQRTYLAAESESNLAKRQGYIRQGDDTLTDLVAHIQHNVAPALKKVLDNPLGAIVVELPSIADFREVADSMLVRTGIYQGLEDAYNKNLPLNVRKDDAYETHKRTKDLRKWLKKQNKWPRLRKLFRKKDLTQIPIHLDSREQPIGDLLENIASFCVLSYNSPE